MAPVSLAKDVFDRAAKLCKEIGSDQWMVLNDYGGSFSQVFFQVPGLESIEKIFMICAAEKTDLGIGTVISTYQGLTGIADNSRPELAAENLSLFIHEMRQPA